MTLLDIVLIWMYFGILTIPYSFMEYDETVTWKTANIFQRYAMRHKFVYGVALVIWAASTVIIGISSVAFLLQFC